MHADTYQFHPQYKGGFDLRGILSYPVKKGDFDLGEIMSGGIMSVHRPQRVAQRRRHEDDDQLLLGNEVTYANASKP